MAQNVLSPNRVITLECPRFTDFRGDLSKVYRRGALRDYLTNIEEVYISTSNKNAIRGMHYQLGEHAQDKLIFCITGRMIDVSIDLRPTKNLGKVELNELCQNDNKIIFVPKNFAHGIISLENSTTYLNISPQRYSPGDEYGIRWDSLGLDFAIHAPLVSDKDKSWPTLKEAIASIRKRSV
jgi:dTDP-4-dehydrorhamnose 3,5-epimerase